MSGIKIITPFYDLEKKGIFGSGFFFLEHVLKARADLNMETGSGEYEQEMNVYIAGLLNSLINSDNLLSGKPYISPFDIDIKHWLDNHPGLRNEYNVYRDNADFGLVFLGLFLKFNHSGSYHSKILSGSDEQGRVALYYEMASSALAHLQGNSASLVGVFQALADNMPEILQIVRRAATEYFEFIEKISDGSLYHLEKEIDKMDYENLYKSKLDEFLKKYSEYKEKPNEKLRTEVISMAQELKEMNKKFQFDSGTM